MQCKIKCKQIKSVEPDKDLPHLFFSIRLYNSDYAFLEKNSSDYKEGDFVVHFEHGSWIPEGVFNGIGNQYCRLKSGIITKLPKIIDINTMQIWKGEEGVSMSNYYGIRV